MHGKFFAFFNWTKLYLTIFFKDTLQPIYTRDFFSESCIIKPNLDYNLQFSIIDLGTKRNSVNFVFQLRRIRDPKQKWCVCLQIQLHKYNIIPRYLHSTEWRCRCCRPLALRRLPRSWSRWRTWASGDARTRRSSYGTWLRRLLKHFRIFNQSISFISSKGHRY